MIVFSETKMSTFIFDGTFIHRISPVNFKDNYSFHVSTSKFNFSKTQLLFLSIKAFNHFKNSRAPFEISPPSSSNEIPNFSLEDLTKWFSQLHSLFKTTTEIEINLQNVLYFKYLAKILDNPLLKKISKKVLSSKKSQIFKLSSEQLSSISQNKKDSLTNFKLIINNQIFQVNSSLLSCVSNKFLQMDDQTKELSFTISDEHFDCFSSFLDLFDGIPFQYSDFEISSLLLLIENFDLNILLEILSSEVPIPNSISEAIKFLSFSSTSKLENQSEASFSIFDFSF